MQGRWVERQIMSSNYFVVDTKQYNFLAFFIIYSPGMDVYELGESSRAGLVQTLLAQLFIFDSIQVAKSFGNFVLFRREKNPEPMGNREISP